MNDEIVIRLSLDDFDYLLLMMGYAAGAAHREGNMRLFHEFLRVTNAVNKDNPNFIPYEIPEMVSDPA